MIYFVSVISGILNGLFAAAAGQIIVLYFVFALKLESHISRATSIFCMSVVTILSFLGYIRFAKFKLYQVIMTIACGLVFGNIGSKIMNKIKSSYLNLISGCMIFLMGMYKLFVSR